MEPNATPDVEPKRPTNYPAHLAVMTTDAGKAAIVAAAAERGGSQGAVVRSWLEHGQLLEAAYLARPGLRESVRKLAADSGASEVDAIGKLLDFGVREAARRLERNARAAAALGEAFYEATGIAPDYVELPGVTIRTE